MPRLFVADDDDAMCRMIVRIASERGWLASSCANGRELLDALRAWPEPALVLVDVQMPEVDGIETIDGLIALPRLDRLRVRFFTGGPDVGAIAARMIAEARNVSVGPTILKPFRLEVLEQVLTFEQERLSGIRSMPGPGGS